MKKIFLGFGLFFCEWCHKWSSFLAILAHVTWLRAQPLYGSISLKFSMETRIWAFWYLDWLSSVLDQSEILFFSHKLWTQNNSKSYKVSKDLDFSLVSNKNFSEILHLAVWAWDQMKWTKKAKKNSTYDVTHKKKSQNQKFFFITDAKTCWIFWGFEQLSSTIG